MIFGCVLTRGSLSGAFRSGCCLANNQSNPLFFSEEVSRSHRDYYSLSKSDFRNSIAPWVGLAAPVGFSIGIVYLLGQVTANETQPSRMVYLFSGVEAIASAAAGYFFGTKVHRERAEKAESAWKSRKTPGVSLRWFE